MQDTEALGEALALEADRAKERDEQLTVSQIMNEIGWIDRSSLARYPDNEQTRTLLSASGASRPTYPKAALPALVALYQAHKERKCTPKTAPMLISSFLGAVPTVVLPDARTLRDNRILELSEQRTSVLPEKNAPVAEMVQVMRELISTVKDIAPVPEDRALSRSQAATLLGCAPRTVSRCVRPLRRGAYRRSDCLRYIKTGIPVTTPTTEAPVASLTMMVENPTAQTVEVNETTEVDWYAPNLEVETREQNERSSEIENWLRAKMITKAEAELLARADVNGPMDPKDVDKLLKIRRRVKAAKALARNPRATEEAEECHAKWQELLTSTLRESALITAGLE